MYPSDPTARTTLPQWIGRHAHSFGQRTALTFVGDDSHEESWTYSQLWEKACAVASRLPTVDEPAPRGLLLFPPGLEFLAGFLGCQIAGWTPVPTCYPKAGREMPRLDSAASDCRPSALICDQATEAGLANDRLCQAAGEIPRVLTDGDDTGADRTPVDPDSLNLDPDALALLQYTSGSTSDPKGVMVRHRNLMANLEAIRRGFQIAWQSEDQEEIECGVFWLPFFHDMGLIGGILSPLYVGGQAVLMSPRSFLQRPIRWLQNISNYRATISGAPNFAYQLCVDRIAPEQTSELDLSRWRLAFSGAEPILPRTLSDFANRFSSCGFKSSAFYPCYGLAEATLLAAGGDGPREPTILSVGRESLGAGKPEIVESEHGPGIRNLVNCGGPAHQTELTLVDPNTHQQVGELVVGEIWLRGDSVTAGYWHHDAENSQVFDASLSDGRSGYFRTGDLGFIHEGQLYVTGRLKDVIILRGRNLFPQDIETTVRAAVGSEGGQCAAFSVEAARGEALAVVAELPRRFDEAALPEVSRSIRRAVIEEHEVDPRHILLVRQATVPLTSSGKVQRSRCRELFNTNQIKSKFRYDRSSTGAQSPIAMPKLPPHPTPQDHRGMVGEIEKWMSTWLVARAGVDPDDLRLDKPFADYGLDSITAVEMSAEIEDWSSVELTPVVAWNHPTITRLATFIADQILELGPVPQQASDSSEAELEDLLDAIDQLPDDEINDTFA